MHPDKPLIVIVGPTASGKSALAMAIARKYSGELICADSRTVYKGMDIGTAKPSPEDRQEIRHHLLDLVEPGQAFSAATFKLLANQAIADIRSRGKLPIIVGGTGLYVDAVIFNYQFGSVADQKKREDLQQKSIQELQQECSERGIDLPINSKNKRHLIRAIELNGLPTRTDEMIDNCMVVGITTEKHILKERIEARAWQMVNAGIVEEVGKMGKKYGWDSEAMTGNIYRIFKDVVQGSKQIDQAIEEFVRSDMRLAKRQITWFKRNSHIIWGQPLELEKRINDYIRAASHFDTIGQTGSKRGNND